MAAPRPFTDLNEPVFWDKNNKRLGRNSAILSSDLHQIWRLFAKLYSAVYNRHRIHSAIGYMTPDEFAARWEETKTEEVANR